MSPATQKIVKWPLPFILLSLFVACAGKPQPTKQETSVSIAQQPTPSPGKTLESPGARALVVARKMLGTPYRYGGNDPRGFDCSGLVQYTFSLGGAELPRTSGELFRISQRIDLKKIEPGDLVFFTISANKISHVGIYAGHNSFIHSPSSGKGVSYASIEAPYWKKRLVAAGRL